MIMPMLKEDYQNKDLSELLKARQKVMKELIRIENEDLYLYPKKDNSEPPFEAKMLMNPSPDVVWNVLNEDLQMLNELIEEHNVDELMEE